VGDPGGSRSGRSLFTVLHPGSPATSEVRSGGGKPPSHEPVRGGWTIGSSKDGPEWLVSLFQWWTRSAYRLQGAWLVHPPEPLTASL